MRKLTPLMVDALAQLFADRNHWLKLGTHRLATLVGLIERGLITPLVPFWGNDGEQHGRHHVLTTAGIDWLLDNHQYGSRGCEPLDLVRQRERDAAHSIAVDEDQERMHGPALEENLVRTTAARAHRAGDRLALVELRAVAERSGLLDVAENVIRPLIEQTIKANIKRAAARRAADVTSVTEVRLRVDTELARSIVEADHAAALAAVVDAAHVWALAECATDSAAKAYELYGEAKTLIAAIGGPRASLASIGGTQGPKLCEATDETDEGRPLGPCVLPADHDGAHDEYEHAYETALAARAAEEHAAELARRNLPVSRALVEDDFAAALRDPRADRHGADSRWTRVATSMYRIGPDVSPLVTAVADVERRGRFMVWIVGRPVDLVEWNGEVWAPVDKPLCGRTMLNDRSCVREFGHYGLCSSKTDVAAVKAGVETRALLRPQPDASLIDASWIDANSREHYTCGETYFDGYVGAERVCVKDDGHDGEHAS